MIAFDNDKFSFSEMSLEEREETIDKVLRELGDTYAFDTFLEIADKHAERIGNIRELDWSDVSPTDAVFDNAGTPFIDAVLELCMLTYADYDMGWEEACEDVLSQLG